MNEQQEIEWCQCETRPEERTKTCEVVCICKKCGKPIKPSKGDHKPPPSEQ